MLYIPKIYNGPLICSTIYNYSLDYRGHNRSVSLFLMTPLTSFIIGFLTCLIIVFLGIIFSIDQLILFWLCVAAFPALFIYGIVRGE